MTESRFDGRQTSETSTNVSDAFMKEHVPYKTPLPLQIVYKAQDAGLYAASGLIATDMYLNQTSVDPKIAILAGVGSKVAAHLTATPRVQGILEDRRTKKEEVGFEETLLRERELTATEISQNFLKEYGTDDNSRPSNMMNLSANVALGLTGVFSAIELWNDASANSSDTEFLKTVFLASVGTKALSKLLQTQPVEFITNNTVNRLRGTYPEKK